MQYLSVYIHIPFCVQKCHYCDFLSAPASKEKMAQYVDALKREIKTQAEKYKAFIVKTIFFGGGTPSILQGEQIADILGVLKENYNLQSVEEITIEMNPATATREKMTIWKDAGINRLSIGLQSTKDDELKMIGRVHCFQDFLDSYQMAREVGFENISVDLMSGLPGQTLETWEKTLQTVLALNTEHISAYSLIVEEGTRLYENIDAYPPIPSEEIDREMYQRTKSLLKEYGYERYEISNYAQNGYESKHNCVYWQRGNYVGFGLGASSMVDNVRWNNHTDFNDYIKNCEHPELLHENIEKLSKTDCMEEFMFLGLRMMKGIQKKQFQELFSQKVEEVYGEVIQKWEKRNMLVQDEDVIRLTDAGIDISNVIFSDFLA